MLLEKRTENPPLTYLADGVMMYNCLLTPVIQSYCLGTQDLIISLPYITINVKMNYKSINQPIVQFSSQTLLLMAYGSFDQLVYLPQKLRLLKLKGKGWVLLVPTLKHLIRTGVLKHSKLYLTCPLPQTVQSALEVEPSQPAHPGGGVSVGVRTRAAHARTLFPRAAQLKFRSHLKGCQLSRPSLCAQPPPRSPLRPTSGVGSSTFIGRPSAHSYSRTSHLSSGGERRSQWESFLGQLPGPESREAVPGAGCGQGISCHLE